MNSFLVYQEAYKEKEGNTTGRTVDFQESLLLVDLLSVKGKVSV